MVVIGLVYSVIVETCTIVSSVNYAYSFYCSKQCKHGLGGENSPVRQTRGIVTKRKNLPHTQDGLQRPFPDLTTSALVHASLGEAAWVLFSIALTFTFTSTLLLLPAFDVIMKALIMASSLPLSSVRVVTAAIPSAGAVSDTSVHLLLCDSRRRREHKQSESAGDLSLTKIPTSSDKEVNSHISVVRINNCVTVAL